MINFEIEGNPKALKRHRVGKNGRMYDPSFIDKKRFNAKAFEFRPKRPLTGDLMVRLIFVLKRPKKHYRTGKFHGIIKDRFRDVYPAKAPDLDNLVKMALDSMNKFFFKDDSQVIQLQAMKIYECETEQPKTEIYIDEL